MGVYIKDLPMPKRCLDCYYLKWTEAPEIYECKFTNRLVLEDDAEEKRHEDCPLVEIKAHGALIDSANLMIEMMDNAVDDMQGADGREVGQIIMDASIILEAEE